MFAVSGGGGACQLEACTEPVWMINFTEIVVEYRKAMDGDIGVDTVEKEKILQDAKNKFICYMFRFASGHN